MSSATLLWPLDQTDAALAALASTCRLGDRTPQDVTVVDPEVVVVPDLAARRDLDAVAVELTAPRLSEQVTAGPMLIRLGDGWLALHNRRGSGVSVVTPDGRGMLTSPALRNLVFPAPRDTVNGTVAGIEGRRRAAAIDAIASAWAVNREPPPAWILRMPASAPIAAQLRRSGLRWRVALFGALVVVEYVLWLLAFAVPGAALLAGSFAPGRVAVWVGVLVAVAVTRSASLWLSGRVVVDAGALLRRRLIAGALRLEPDEIRREGTGRLVGRVLESESVESLALSGGTSAAVAIVELTVLAVVMLWGAGGIAQSAALVVWVTVVLLLAQRYATRRRAWTTSRRAITGDLVEQMLGHRTRRVQEDPARRDARDERGLSTYRGVSERLDRATPALLALGVRGWPILGFAVLVPRIASGGLDASGLAVALGTVLLATWSLEHLTLGLGDLGAARIAWDQARLLVEAAARPTAPVRPTERPTSDTSDQAVLVVDDLSFGYTGRADRVLDDVDGAIRLGDRILLQGASGSGKTTLALLLAGLLDADAGSLALRGRTRDEWGPAAWRQRVVLAPQFHDNHLLQASLAFNVLLGRSWPARWSDIDEAAEVLRELGLGPVLDRMPAGMMQQVGESGWQLSHGERSRVFIARALLQRADVVVLDESFGALDPQTMQLALDVVARRCPSLLVIAHP